MNRFSPGGGVSVAYVFNDGGRADAGYRGSADDCVTRAISIATGKPYKEIYEIISKGSREQRVTGGNKPKVSARQRVNTGRKWFKDYMVSLGFAWVPTMQVGAGCQVHLTASELPKGRLIVSVSKHYTVMIDGVIHDTHDPSRNGSRCVYGYWIAD
jgi:hypothetical protein